MTKLPSGQLAFSMPETVQSVVRCPTNGPLLAAAAQLWIADDDLVVDVTYGRGMFWTHYRPGRLVAHDLALDGVDFRHCLKPTARSTWSSSTRPTSLRAAGIRRLSRTSLIAMAYGTRPSHAGTSSTCRRP